jgi:hypothetical protein
MEPTTPPDAPPPAASAPKPARREVRLDPEFQARALAQMREERDAAVRQRTLLRWIGIPLTLASLAASIFLDRTEYWALAHMADLITTAACWFFWRAYRRGLWS